MFSLTGLDGSTIYVTVDSLIRIRPALPEDAPPSTEVEFDGGYIFTHEAIPDLLARLGSTNRFVKLTSPGGTSVFLNASSISSVRSAEAINGPGTEIIVAGLYQHVVETTEQVQALIAA